MLRKFALAAVAAALTLILFDVPSASAQPRPAAPSFGQAFRAGAGFGLGQRLGFAAPLPGFGFRTPFFLPGRGGFYGAPGFFPGRAFVPGFVPARGFYGVPARNLFVPQRFFAPGFYGAGFYPQAAPVILQQAPPVVIEQPAPVIIQQAPPIIQQAPVPQQQPQALLLPSTPTLTLAPGYAANYAGACGAVGATLAPGYGAFAGCGRTAALLPAALYRGFYR